MGLTTSRTDLEIRRAQREDMPEVAGFVRSSADWYREIVPEEDMAEHEVDKEWQKKNYELREFYIGSVNGKSVGTISLQFFDNVAYLGYIYLDVQHVGKGYGHELMTFAEVEARDRGAKKLALIAHPEATWAKNAYLKYGFEIVEESEEGVKSWKDGVLEPYYESGFELYLYDFDKNPAPKKEEVPEVINV